MECNKYALHDIGIAGANLLPLPVIEAAGGPVLRMLRPDCPLLPDFSNGFGEIYFSEIFPGVTKAWKLHKRQTQLFSVPVGQIKIALYDARADSPTFSVLAVTILGRPDNYNLLRIPAGIWYGFQAMNDNPALICNCADIPHDPDEGEHLPLKNSVIPYQW